MGEKKRIASWKYDQEEGILSLTNAETKDNVLAINIPEAIPGFLELPEFVQFYIQYGIRQKSADPNAGEKGEDKLEGMRLSLESWEKVTFKTAHGPRESAQTKVNKELEGICLGFLESSGGKISKQAQSWFLSTVGKISDEEVRKGILAKANIQA